MDPDALHAGLLGADLHIPLQLALGHGEDPLVGLEVVESLEVILHLLAQERWHLHGAVALRRLGCGDDVTPVDALIGLVNPHRAALEVEISRRQRQHFALAKAAPVKHFKGIVGIRFVHHHLGEFQVFLLCPEGHLPASGLAHVADLGSRIAGEAVMFHCVVEQAGELIVDRFEIYGGIRLPVLVAVIQHHILPGHHVACGDLAHFLFAEVGHKLCLDDVLLHPPGGFLQAGTHVLGVLFHERGKGHVQIGSGFVQLFTLPGERFALGGEAPLLGLPARAGKVGITINHAPGVGLFFLVYGQFITSLRSCRSRSFQRRTAY